MRLTREFLMPAGARRLQQMLGLFLLFRVLTESPDADRYWGSDGLAPAVMYPFGLWSFDVNVLVMASLVALAATALLLFVGKWTRTGSAVGLIAFCYLQARLPAFCDAGDFLARLLLLCSTGMAGGGAHADEKRPLVIMLHNAALIVVASQACVIYAAAGFAKLNTNEWRTGEVVELLAGHPVFSSGLFRFAARSWLLSQALCILIIIQQLAWPLAVVTRLRKPWVAASGVFHLFIGVTMGLMSFSLAMLALDALFFSSPFPFTKAGPSARAAGGIIK